MTAHAGTRFMGDGQGAPFDRDQRAACKAPGVDAEAFFAPDRERRGPAKDRREAKAKAICRRCPLVDDCAAWAMDEKIEYGVWGGLTEDERIALARRDTPADTDAAPTYCRKGHLLDEANTYIVPSRPDRRRCRTCGREDTANARERKRQARVAAKQAAQAQAVAA